MSVDVVDVWLVGTDLPDQVVAELTAVLDDGERQRADAMSPPGRRQFVVAHGVARLVLGHRLGVAPRRIRLRRGRNGKPELAWPATGTRVNLSHSADLAAVAVSDRRPVGVDVQCGSDGRDPVRLATRFYPPAEAALVAAEPGGAGRASQFHQLWARKEACLKAGGGRLVDGLRLPVHGTGPVVVTDPDGALPGPFLVHDVPAPAGFTAAIALTGAAGFLVVPHSWPGWPGENVPDDDNPMAVRGCWTARSA